LPRHPAGEVRSTQWRDGVEQHIDMDVRHGTRDEPAELGGREGVASAAEA